MNPGAAVSGHGYIVRLTSGRFDGMPAEGEWIGKRSDDGRWLLHRAAGGQVLSGVRDHEVVILL